MNKRLIKFKCTMCGREETETLPDQEEFYNVPQKACLRCNFREVSAMVVDALPQTLAEKIWGDLQKKAAEKEADRIKANLQKANEAGGPMDFSEALKAMEMGCKVQRQGWNGKGMWLHVVIATAYEVTFVGQPIKRNADSFNTLPFIQMKTADNKFVPWLASQTDLLSDDWWIVT